MNTGKTMWSEWCALILFLSFACNTSEQGFNCSAEAQSLTIGRRCILDFPPSVFVFQLEKLVLQPITKSVRWRRACLEEIRAKVTEPGIGKRKALPRSHRWSLLKVVEDVCGSGGRMLGSRRKVGICEPARDNAADCRCTRSVVPTGLHSLEAYWFQKFAGTQNTVDALWLADNQTVFGRDNRRDKPLRSGTHTYASKPSTHP